MNMRIGKRMLVLGGVALIAAAGGASVTVAQSQPKQTPENWPWMYDRNGKRVPRPKNVVVEQKADGSTREVSRLGNCVTVKDKSESGSRETQQCNPR